MPEARETRKPQGYAECKKPSKSRAGGSRTLAALDVVRAVRERDAFAQDVIGTRIDRSDLSSEDHRSLRSWLSAWSAPRARSTRSSIARSTRPAAMKPDVHPLQ